MFAGCAVAFLLKHQSVMKPLKELSTNFKTKGHRILLMALLTGLLINPFLHHYAQFQWVLVVILVLMLLAAVRTVANANFLLINYFHKV